MALEGGEVARIWLEQSAKFEGPKTEGLQQEITRMADGLRESLGGWGRVAAEEEEGEEEELVRMERQLKEEIASLKSQFRAHAEKVAKSSFPSHQRNDAVPKQEKQEKEDGEDQDLSALSVVLETNLMQQIESLRLQVDAAHGQAQAIHRGSVREAVAHGSSRQERALNGVELTPEPGKPVLRTAAQSVAVAASTVEAEAPAGRQGAPRHGMGATPRRGARSGRTPRQGQGSGKARLSRKPIIDLSMNFAAGGLL